MTPGTQGGEPRWVLNNGATGMPNFHSDRAGLLTRVALSPFEGRERRFGQIATAGRVHIDAIGVDESFARMMGCEAREMVAWLPAALPGAETRAGHAAPRAHVRASGTSIWPHSEAVAQQADTPSNTN